MLAYPLCFSDALIPSMSEEIRVIPVVFVPDKFDATVFH